MAMKNVLTLGVGGKAIKNMDLEFVQLRYHLMGAHILQGLLADGLQKI